MLIGKYTDECPFFFSIPLSFTKNSLAKLKVVSLQITRPLYIVVKIGFVISKFRPVQGTLVPDNSIPGSSTVPHGIPR